MVAVRPLSAELTPLSALLRRSGRRWWWWFGQPRRTVECATVCHANLLCRLRLRGRLRCLCPPCAGGLASECASFTRAHVFAAILAAFSSDCAHVSAAQGDMHAGTVHEAFVAFV